MEFSRQEHWSGLPFPSPGDLPHPGIEPEHPALAGRIFTTEPPGKLKQSQINSVSSLVNRDGRETLTSQSCHEHQMKGLYRKVDVTGRGGERGFTISKEAFRV